ncbi:hypothetical protein [Catellatospora tritici]|uniref:hypothetical protein n=1 Tax=Catellatospora tritici TaxID=2851566 RepID=UPI001C2D24DD|nr:hypothetical protein [Catellatospora tritici]
MTVRLADSIRASNRSAPCPEGDLGLEELGLLIRVQRVGDVVLTRPVFAVVRAIANTMWDSLPADEFRGR